MNGVGDWMLNNLSADGRPHFAAAMVIMVRRRDDRWQKWHCNFCASGERMSF